MKYNNYYRKLSESQRFSNEFLEGLTAQQYVNRMLVQKMLAELQKANRKLADDYHD